MLQVLYSGGRAGGCHEDLPEPHEVLSSPSCSSEEDRRGCAVEDDGDDCDSPLPLLDLRRSSRSLPENDTDSLRPKPWHRTETQRRGHTRIAVRLDGRGWCVFLLDGHENPRAAFTLWKLMAGGGIVVG